MSSSSQTTEILFNSPALHSLKRDQLVKLCKVHSVKASGKNVELIERLKKVAENLPKGAPLSIAARSDAHENEDMEVDEITYDKDKENSFPRRIDETTTKEIPRPSEQWAVMESIAEVDNESGGSRNGTLKSVGSNRDFATGGSKSSTVSSIKAFASSLGLKRSTSAKSAMSTSTYDSSSFTNPPLVPSMSAVAQDELSKHATPYSSLPVPSPSQMPQTDHFSDFSHFKANPPSTATLHKFDFANREDATPLPGHVLRPGLPAPENARLSLGDARFSLGIGTPRKSTSGPTTTIRLVSSSSMTSPPDSPEPSSTSIFRFSNEHGDTPQLKPWTTSFDLILGSPTGPAFGENVKIYPDLPMDDVNQSPTKFKSPMPGTLSLPQPALAAPSPASLNVKPETFVFGSPLPQHRVSDAQFKSAATSVLEEMNKRLLADGVDTIGTSLISNLRPGAADLSPSTKKSYTNREIKPLRKSFGVKSKFEKAHQDQFQAMESIAGYLDRKNNVVAGSSGSVPRKANEVEKDDDEPVQVGKKRKSNVLGEARPTQAKRPSTRVISNSRRKIPGGFGDDDDDEEQEAPTEKKARVEFSRDDDVAAKKAEDEVAAAERLDKEREAIRRRLEINRARRRSSAANGRASMGRGRQSVGRAGVLQKQLPKPASKSRFGFLSSAAKSLVKGVWGGNKKPGPTPVPASTTAKTTSSSTTAKASASSSATANASTDAKGKVGPPASGAQRKVSGPVKPSVSASQVSSTSSRVSHSRNASNSGTMTSLASAAATIHSARSRSPLPSFAAPTRSSSIRTSTTGTASTRNSSIASRAAGSSSIGGTGTSRNSNVTSRVSSLGARGSLAHGPVTSSSSRLLAPTASSLAKTSAASKLKSNTLNVPITKPSDSSSSSPLSSNANTSGINASPAPGKIFSKPLVVPVGSGLPSPVRGGASQAIPAGKPRSLSGRKPRISRSKVIAKLASQRTASGSGYGGPSTSLSSSGQAASGTLLAAKRSSLGIGVHKAPRKSAGGGALRKSHVGVAGAGVRTSEASVLLSAKRRARQSEYTRRRSRVAGGSGFGIGIGIPGAGAAMDVSS